MTSIAAADAAGDGATVGLGLWPADEQAASRNNGMAMSNVRRVMAAGTSIGVGIDPDLGGAT
jgi:hypothetical protein